jgi:rubrerythrin
VGLWHQIRDALNAVWAEWQRPRTDERARLIIELTEAWRAEERVSTQIRRIIPAILYEQFRRRLDAIVRDDERHATLLQERLRILGGMVGESFKASEGSENSTPGGPWRRLQQVLAAKRELYERYRQAASVVADPGLQSLLEQLRDDEERHQEELIEMLMQLDAHVHETIA